MKSRSWNEAATVKGDSMHEEIILSGFGGQGVLFAGQLLAYAAVEAGKHVTWIPSYGPEMRGGTAHCTVVVSDEPIGSPLVRHPTSAIALNLPSFEKYESLIKPGGLLVYNRSLIVAEPTRAEIRYVAVPANVIAEELGNVRQANVVLLGAYLAVTGLLSLSAVETALDNHLSERQRSFLASNKQALRRGAAGVVSWQQEPIAAGDHRSAPADFGLHDVAFRGRGADSTDRYPEPQQGG
jgi:2-oxoglutarate ferredoxin oxidoreductase subunit gamma